MKAVLTLASLLAIFTIAGCESDHHHRRHDQSEYRGAREYPVYGGPAPYETHRVYRGYPEEPYRR